MKKTLYKVLNRAPVGLTSPYMDFSYTPGVEYECPNFDPDPTNTCSHGFYATEVDGLPYAWSQGSLYSSSSTPREVWEVEVSGQAVEIDQFKRRYERIKLIRHVPDSEVQALAKEKEQTIKYRLSEILFPVRPETIEAGPVSPAIKELMSAWVSVLSRQIAVSHILLDSLREYVRESTREPFWWANVMTSTGSDVIQTMENLIWSRHSGMKVSSQFFAYLSTLFPLKEWKYVKHSEDVNPFHAGGELWRRGFVVSLKDPSVRTTYSQDQDKVWQLHAGPHMDIVYTMPTLRRYSVWSGDGNSRFYERDIEVRTLEEAIDRVRSEFIPQRFWGDIQEDGDEECITLILDCPGCVLQGTEDCLGDEKDCGYSEYLEIELIGKLPFHEATEDYEDYIEEV